MAASNMYVTPAGAGTKDGSSWPNAFGLPEWETDAETLAEPGDLYYLLAGAYGLTANFDARLRDGTGLAPIRVIGVSDEALTPGVNDDRPAFSVVNKQFRFGQHWHVENLRGAGTVTGGFFVESYGLFRNIKSVCNSGTAIDLGGSYVTAIDCEAVSTANNAITIMAGADSTRILGCYVHDSGKGIHENGDMTVILNSIIAGCTKGIEGYTRHNRLISGNTIYNCGDGILGVASYGVKVLNNIIAGCVKGAEWTTEQKSNLFDYNDWWNNGTDVLNVTKGPNATAIDPQFVDAAGGNFQIGAALRHSGFPGLFPGNLTRSYLDVGAVQSREEIPVGPFEHPWR